jgi:hypothetical protein
MTHLKFFALRIEFKEEKTDNSLTTGTGLFEILIQKQQKPILA